MVFVSNNRGGGWGCLILGILSLVAAYYILKGFFIVLWWAAPALFVLALIINWRAVAETGKDFLRLLERNPLGGLLLGALAVVGFPVLSLYLFTRALGYNRIEKFGQRVQENRQMPEEEFVEFEELESRPKYTAPASEEPVDEPIEPVEPMEPPREEVPKPGNPYDQLFK